MNEDAIRVDPSHRGGAHSGTPGGHGGGGLPVGRGGRGGGNGLPVPTELIVLVVTALAVLIAAATADNLESPSAWTLVTVLATAYILSRGFAKYERRGDHRD